jgi:hypothetical protein
MSYCVFSLDENDSTADFPRVSAGNSYLKKPIFLAVKAVKEDDHTR